MSSRAARLATPNPPPSRRANAAMARSASGLGERAEVTGEVGVAQEQRPRLEPALGQRQRLSLPPARKPDHVGTGLRGGGGGAIAGAVVGDHDARLRERLPQALDGQRDPLVLVARGDEDRESSRHPCVVGTAVTGGRTPSLAVVSTP